MGLGPERNSAQSEEFGGTSPCSTSRSSHQQRVYRVGCALLPKKVQRYYSQGVRSECKRRGLELVLLDHTRPLLEQGYYDAILHKLRPNKEWERNLQDYLQAHPGVKVIDSLAGIRIVHNRATMLLPLRERPEGITLQAPPPPGPGHGPRTNSTITSSSSTYDAGASGGGFATARVQSPTQVEIAEGCTLAGAQTLLAAAGLRPPLLVKPLWTDGREGSHGLAVLHDMAALSKVLQGGVSSELKPPLVVQQFVAHGGVLFKVYVLGVRTVVCRRPSLGDSYLGQEARRAGVLSLPRVSCKSTYAKDSPEYRFSAGVIYSSTSNLAGMAGMGSDSAVVSTDTAAHEEAAVGGGVGGAAGFGGAVDVPRVMKRVGGGSGGQFARPPLSPPSTPPPAQTLSGSGNAGAAAAAAAAAAPATTDCTSPPPPPAAAAVGASAAAAQPPQPLLSTPPGAAQELAAAAAAAPPPLYNQYSEQHDPQQLAMVPPDWVTSALAGALREKLGLQLFNFDMICPEQQLGAPAERLYYVVDVNYFPGVDKLDNFEQLFVDFLRAACEGEGGQQAATGGMAGVAAQAAEAAAPAGACKAGGGSDVVMAAVGRAEEADGAGRGDDDGASSVSCGEGEAHGLLVGEANGGAPAPAAGASPERWEAQVVGVA